MLLAESARPLTDAHLFSCAKSRVRLRAPPAGALGVPPGGRAGTRTEGLVSWELAQAGGGGVAGSGSCIATFGLGLLWQCRSGQLAKMINFESLLDLSLQPGLSLGSSVHLIGWP